MMKTEGNNQSVIAKLMGFDEVSYKQQPVYRQRRVLSDNYLQKSVSIGSRENASRKRRQIIKDNPNLTIKDSRKDVSFGYIGEKRRFSDGMQGVYSRNSLENGKLVEGIKESNDFIELNSPKKIVVLRPNLGNAKRSSKPSFLLDSQTTVGWEFKKQLLERSKRTKICQELGSSRWVSNLGGMPSMADLGSKRKSGVDTRVFLSGNEGRQDKSVTKLPIFKRFNISSHPNTKLKKLSVGDLKSRFEKHNNVPPRNSEEVEQITEQIACNDSSKVGCFSCSLDASFELDSPSEDRFTSLNCMDIDDGFPRSMNETYQTSPNSVLEPDNSSSSENGDNVSTDLKGLWMKLQILKSESEENQCKSSDGDSTERSSPCGHKIKNPIRWIGPKDNQEFSYLVNVLNESGFHFDNVEISFENWHTPDRIMNPSLFETLEKKTEKHEPWSKADRRLFFDRLNSGLSEILRPEVNFCFSKPLKRKFGTGLRRDVIEEELWKLLLSEGKEVNSTVSEKAVAKELWLELGDEMGFIVEEIEAFLLDELAREFAAI